MRLASGRPIVEVHYYSIVAAILILLLARNEENEYYSVWEVKIIGTKIIVSVFQ